MREKVVKCYIMPLPQLSYVYWLTNFKVDYKYLNIGGRNLSQEVTYVIGPKIRGGGIIYTVYFFQINHLTFWSEVKKN